jgi:hypothetical protein
MTTSRPDHFADKFPTAEELVILREAYAETYPVRPLLNEIDRLRAMNAELINANDAGCMGATMLARENQQLRAEHERLRAHFNDECAELRRRIVGLVAATNRALVCPRKG